MTSGVAEHFNIDVEHQAPQSPAVRGPGPARRAFGLGFVAGCLACACVAAVALSGAGAAGAGAASKFAPGLLPPSGATGVAAAPERASVALRAEPAGDAPPPAPGLLGRRSALGVILAAPAAAVAANGDAPKQSYFGASPMSAPFGETYTNQDTRLWSELGETEKAIFTRIVGQTRDQLVKTEGYIDKEKWIDARAALRLYAYDTRKSMKRLSAGGENAERLREVFKQDIEKLDASLVAKNYEVSRELVKDAIGTLYQWAGSIGIML